MMHHKRAVGDVVRVPDGRQGKIYCAHTVPSSYWQHWSEGSKGPRAIPVEAYEVRFPDGASDGYCGHDLRLVKRAAHRPGDRIGGATVASVTVDPTGATVVTLVDAEGTSTTWTPEPTP